MILMYAWVAYPFTLFALSTNSNDALVSALIVLALLAITLALGARDLRRAGRADEVRAVRAGAAAVARDR